MLGGECMAIILPRLAWARVASRIDDDRIRWGRRADGYIPLSPTPPRMPRSDFARVGAGKSRELLVSFGMRALPLLLSARRMFAPIAHRDVKQNQAGVLLARLSPVSCLRIQ